MNEQLQQLINGLNEDLAHEYGAVVQYSYSASVVSGIHRTALKPHFEREVSDELRHASYLAEKIHILGGTPTTEPANVPQPTSVKDILTAIHKSELDTIERYKQRIKQAKNLDMIELAITLEDMVLDETHHKEGIERLLMNSDV